MPQLSHIQKGHHDGTELEGRRWDLGQSSQVGSEHSETPVLSSLRSRSCRAVTEGSLQAYRYDTENGQVLQCPLVMLLGLRCLR